MQRNAILPPIQSSFLSCPKDVEIVLNKLFKESKPYSNWLKRLLVINTPDCLNPNITKYDRIVNELTVKDLIDQQYLRLKPRILMEEHEDIQSYIYIGFDNFYTNSINPRFRDCTVYFDIVCNISQWDLEDFRSRPLMIAGYIDGILNFSKLSGVGEFLFLGCQEFIMDDNLAGYSLMYQAVHFTEDDAKLEELSSR